MRTFRIVAAALLLPLVASCARETAETFATTSVPASAATGSTDCDRQCLYGVLDQYLTALKARDPATAPWAPGARYIENNVLLEPGLGMWVTLTKLGDFELRFADTRNGEVAFHGVAEETKTTSPWTLRLKVRDRKVVEAEALVVRQVDSGIPFVRSDLTPRPEFYEDLPPGQRTAREEMVKVANGYFDTLQLNDGTLHTSFEPGCNRREDGMFTTNNPQREYPTFAMGCEQQFRLGMYIYDDELRARRYPVVDEERGLVMATGFIDHSGKVGKYRYTDGTEAETVFYRPHSFYFMETFRIRAGKIQSIEAVFTTVPYRMPRPVDAEERPATP